MCAQGRIRSACAFVQSNQNLCWALIAKDAKLLNAENKQKDQNAQTILADLSLLWAHMSEDTLSQVTAPVTIEMLASFLCRYNQYRKRRYNVFVTQRLRSGSFLPTNTAQIAFFINI